MSDNSLQNLQENQLCPTIGYQYASVCVPVTVTPFAKAGATFTKCCGNPVVSSCKNACCGIKNGACTFTISQDVCISVPVTFGAVSTVGDTFVKCNGASADDICAYCDCIVNPTSMSNSTEGEQ